MLDSLSIFFEQNPLFELGLVTIILMCMGFISKACKQPVIVGYIVGGVLLGPEIMNLVQHDEKIQVYAYFGISLLLFLVGLGLSPSIIKEVGKVASIAGLGQVMFTFCIGYLLSLLMGFDATVSIYIAIALTFSSTIVIVKLITDKGDSGTTYGKIALGILIVQDIVAMLILLGISAFATQEGFSRGYAGETLLKVVGLILVARGSARYVLPVILRRLADEKELMLLFIISRAIGLGGLWYYMGFSMEIGALLAGVTLASSQYRYHIFSELRPFRDFFLALFFVYLGGQIVFDGVGSMILPIIIFSAFVLIGNPTIIVSIMLKLGYTPKDSFMVGLTVAQISEFSFIIITLALSTPVLQDPNILSVVTLVGLITMTGSSYMFARADKIFALSLPYIQTLQSILGSKKNRETTNKHNGESSDEYTVVVLGYGRLGRYVCTKLKEHQIPYCIIESDINRVNKAENEHHTVVYGDANDHALLQQIISPQTKMIYSTIADTEVSVSLLHRTKETYPTIKTIGLATQGQEAEHLYNNGADYVLFPHMTGAKESRDVIENHIRHPELFTKHLINQRQKVRRHTLLIQ